MAKPETSKDIKTDTENSLPGSHEGDMTVVGHLQEFRIRLIICLVAVAIGSGASYAYVEEWVKLIAVPVKMLYFMSPGEVFFTYLKIAVFAGFLEALPIIVYEVWAFVAPALTGEERKLARLLTPFSVLLFYGGLAFSYFFVFPAGIKVFLGFATDMVQPMFSLDSYFSFVIAFVLPFGFIFELPLLLLMLAKLGIVTSPFLRKKRKIVLVLAFVVGAIISPTPDVFSQTMIAVPILLLYEASIVMVRWILKK